MTGQVIQTHVGGDGRRAMYRYQVEVDGVVDETVFSGRHKLLASMDVGDVLVFPAERPSIRAAVRGAAYCVARSRRNANGEPWKMRCWREGPSHVSVRRVG